MKWPYIVAGIAFVLIGGFLSYQFFTFVQEEELREYALELQSTISQKEEADSSTDSLPQHTNEEEVTTTPPPPKTSTSNEPPPDLVVKIESKPVIYSGEPYMGYSIDSLAGWIYKGMTAPVTAVLISGTGKSYEIYNKDFYFGSGKSKGGRTSFSPAPQDIPGPGLYSLVLTINNTRSLTETNYENNSDSTVVMVVPGKVADQFDKLWPALAAETSLSSYTWGVSGNDDYFDGGADTDVIQFSQRFSDFEIVRSPISDTSVSDIILLRKKSDDTLDIVVNVEVFYFKDKVLALPDLIKELQ